MKGGQIVEQGNNCWCYPFFLVISVLGASALGEGGIEILFFRILFTVVGCCLAMLVNKYILHYRIHDWLKDLREEYEAEVLELEQLYYLFRKISGHALQSDFNDETL